MATASRKFIPNGDLAFSQMAWRFARGVAHDPGVYHVAAEEAAALTAAVEGFRGALAKARPGGRRSAAPAETAAKDAARREAERLIRRVAGAIRSDDRIDAARKAALGIKVNSARGRSAKELMCPQESPRLVFKQAIHRSVHVPEHELTFGGRSGPAKPAGAARLELFVELVPPDAAVPERPGGSGYGLHYLRSFVKSPIRLVPPMAAEPRRVVYWGRWADAAGDVGPFSAAATGWVEGGSHHLMGLAMPGSLGGEAPARPQVEVVQPAALAELAAQGTRVMVAVMQTQQRYLEGPSAEDAQERAHLAGVKQLTAPGSGPAPEDRVVDGTSDRDREAEDGAWPGREAA